MSVDLCDVFVSRYLTSHKHHHLDPGGAGISTLYCGQQAVYSSENDTINREARGQVQSKLHDLRSIKHGLLVAILSGLHTDIHRIFSALCRYSFTPSVSAFPSIKLRGSGEGSCVRQSVGNVNQMPGVYILTNTESLGSKTATRHGHNCSSTMSYGGK